jgi:AAA15 family ATPase/GTPase
MTLWTDCVIVKRVSIQNFKRLDNLDVDIRPFDCLVGANNSGKTTLLQSLALFDFCVQHCLSRRSGSDEIEIKRRSIAPEDFYVLPIADPNNLWTDRKTQTRSNHILIKITLVFGSSPLTE